MGEIDPGKIDLKSNYTNGRCYGTLKVERKRLGTLDPALKQMDDLTYAVFAEQSDVTSATWDP